GCFDQARKIMKFERTITGKGPVTETYDFKLGIKHIYKKQTGMCDYISFPPGRMTLPLDENHSIDLDDLFHVDITFENIGNDKVRDGVVPVTKYKKKQSPGATFTHTWFMSKSDWAFYKTHLEEEQYEQPLKLVTGALDGSWQLTSMLWDGDINRPYLKKYDVKDCYIPGKNIPKTLPKTDFTISFNRGDYTVQTNEDYTYTYLPINMKGRTKMVIEIQACKDAHIALSKVLDEPETDTYEIVIGGWDNSASAIRANHDGEELTKTLTPGILNCNLKLPFWISWENGQVLVGRGNDPEEGQFMRYVDATSPLEVNAFAVATEGNTGSWTFKNTRDDTMDISFELQMNTPDKVDAVIEKLANSTGLPILRFSQSRLDITPEKLYMTSTLLPNPPIMAPGSVESDCIPGPDCVDLRLISNAAAWKLIEKVVNDGNFKVTFSNGLTLIAEEARNNILRSDLGNIGNDPFLSRFSQDSDRKMIFVDPALKIHGVPVQECARQCLLARDFTCESFSFCPNVGDCLLSTLHSPENSEKGSYKNHSFCDHYSKSYIKSHFTQIPGKVILMNNDKKLEDQSAESCAKACLDEKSFKCESFDYCPNIRECLMSKLHMDNSDSNLVEHKTCNHFSKSILGQFNQINNKAILKNNDIYIANATEEGCAKACVGETSFVCKAFDICTDGGGTACALSRASTGDVKGSDIVDSATCSIFERQSTATRVQKPTGFTSGAAAGLSIGMTILGFLLGAGIMYGVLWKKNQANPDGWGNQLFKTGDTSSA
ncbi:unnamed protein product, partial [Owenia fusiformis]